MIETFYGSFQVLTEKEINGQVIAACVGHDSGFDDMVGFLTVNGAQVRDTSQSFESTDDARKHALNLLVNWGK